MEQSDFFSNGFYQLYADLDHDLYSYDPTDIQFSDEIIFNTWIPETTTSPVNTDFNCWTYNDSTEMNWYNPSQYTYNDEYHISEENSTTYDEFSAVNQSTCDWELNTLDNILWDSCLDINEEDILNPMLPDKTVLCNDTCDLFLKESSDNLKYSLQNMEVDKCTDNSLRRRNSNKKHGCIRTSDDEKTFHCTYEGCNKIYAKATHLKAHIRRHLGDKPYVCTWPNCTWKFSRSDELARHRRSHSGIKPYKCDYCQKCFSRSDHLTKHRKVHEKKLAAMKIKITWTNYPPGKPGRRPKT